MKKIFRTVNSIYDLSSEENYLIKREVRVFLERITPIRNAISHSYPISIRQAEQGIRYSDTYSVNIDINSSFSESEYDIT